MAVTSNVTTGGNGKYNNGGSSFVSSSPHIMSNSFLLIVCTRSVDVENPPPTPTAPIEDYPIAEAIPIVAVTLDESCPPNAAATGYHHQTTTTSAPTPVPQVQPVSQPQAPTPVIVNPNAYTASFIPGYIGRYVQKVTLSM